MTSELVNKFKFDVHSQYTRKLENLLEKFPDYRLWMDEIRDHLMSPNFSTSYSNLDGEVEGYEKVLSAGEFENSSHTQHVHRIGETYISVEGTYSSWSGDGWDEESIVEVFPREVTVIKYEP